jgi:hypothetical protein
MASSPRPYQNDLRKHANSDDLSKRPKSILKEREISEQKKYRLKHWITFYRRNLHRFAEHYGGIKLHMFQKFWLYLMGVSETFVSIAARGIDLKSL